MICFCQLQVSSKDEDFLDLSVDVEQNTSITHCLRYLHKRDLTKSDTVFEVSMRRYFFVRVLLICRACVYRDFSNMETLCSEYKYYCETCCSKQEAQKRSVGLSCILHCTDFICIYEWLIL